MNCVYKHQRAYDRRVGEQGYLSKLWCPDCKRWLTVPESTNVILHLLRKAAGVATSEEQLDLEKEPKP